jgi:hypothetical protein
MMWNTYVRTEYYGEGIENFAISIYASEYTYVEEAEEKSSDHDYYRGSRSMTTSGNTCQRWTS